MWMGLTALAQETVDVDALLIDMTDAVEEIARLRQSIEEEEVIRCLDEKLSSMRALLGIAERAQASSHEAVTTGQAALESRKVMVAAIRQEVLLGLARQCLPAEEVVVTADCPECPDDDPTGVAAEDVLLGPIQQDDEEAAPEAVSPFE